MNGKVNIVFGFFFFACTAILGPMVLIPGKGGNFQKMTESRKAVEEVRKGMEGGFGDALPEKVIAPAVVGIMDYLDDVKRTSFVKSAAHAHGNLESLLNIVVGLVLLSLSIPAAYKTVLSLLFIVGAVFHSGMLYLVSVFGMSWAGNLTKIGVIALLAGLVLMGVATIVGIKGKELQR